jgi:leader peptidase (prepilin peptidase)/N-methyltransferase
MFDPPPIVPILAAPFIGSFLGVLVARLPQGRDVAWSRSQCDSCGHVLAARDLVPLVSWVWLRGRCRYCDLAIGGWPPAMELAATAVAIWAATDTTGWVLVATCVLGWVLLTLAVIDWRCFLLPDVLTLPLVGAGLLVTYAAASPALLNHGIAAAIGLVGAVALAALYRSVRGREGLGLGDAKLLAALGAWIGLEGLPTTLVFAATFGLVHVLAAALRGRPVGLSDKIPLGTFLAAGGWLVWLYGPLVPANW